MVLKLIIMNKFYLISVLLLVVNLPVFSQFSGTPNFFLNANPPTVTVTSVTNPTTGRVWMDRNLGATQVATSRTDAAAYGDLYQWGRGTDGHQLRTSANTSTLSSADVPGACKFYYNKFLALRLAQRTKRQFMAGNSRHQQPMPYRL